MANVFFHLRGCIVDNILQSKRPMVWQLSWMFHSTTETIAFQRQTPDHSSLLYPTAGLNLRLEAYRIYHVFCHENALEDLDGMNCWENSM